MGKTYGQLGIGERYEIYRLRRAEMSLTPQPSLQL